jgi:signal transduction histidine kinase/DNA-binding NarL/FixJ family response regulator
MSNVKRHQPGHGDEAELAAAYARLRQGLELIGSYTERVLLDQAFNGSDVVLAGLMKQIRALDWFAAYGILRLHEGLEFRLEGCEPEAARITLERDCLAHIEQGTFAWALHQNRPVVVSRPDGTESQVLCALATRSRVIGMFAGTVPAGVELHGLELNLLSVLLSLCAYALESVELRDEIHRQNIDLEAQVRHRTHELEVARDKALEAVRAKSEFLANMSHELRTPLNGVLGMLELLAGTGLQREQQEFVETGRRSGQMLMALINDTLDFSKVEAGKMQLEQRPFDLRKLVEESMETVAPRAQKKDIRLVTRTDAALDGAVIGDPTRLRQVLVNLLGNAVKFTERGEIVASVDITGLSGDTVHLRFEISDTGCGIPVEFQSRLFQAFSQADGSITRRYGGTGLGLAICRQLVTLMGGEIGVVSEPGRGSAFHFSLQCRRVAATQAHETESRSGSPQQLVPDNKAAPQAPDRRWHILVVEDNEVNQKVIAGYLRRLGHEFEIVPDGAQAVERAADGGYDLVLMDCQMPVMDGYTAAREIRIRNMRLPIIAMTAHALAGDREKCLAAGMDDYLSKPIDLEALRAQIDTWLVPTTAAPVSAVAPAPGNAGGAEVLNPARITQLRSEIGDMLAELVGVFVADVPRRLAAMRAALAAANVTTARNVAHTLKGSSASLGAERLAGLCAEMERHAAAGAAAEMAATFAAIETEYQAVTTALAALPAGGQPPVSETGK